MNPKVKNIIIFVAVGIVLVLAFIYFLGGDDIPEEGLVSSFGPNTESFSEAEPGITQDFLSLLLSVRSIRLDTSLFSSSSFEALRDSSVILVPDGNEGRPNPFAPIGTDLVEQEPDPVEEVSTQGETGASPEEQEETPENQENVLPDLGIDTELDTLLQELQ